VVIAKFYLISLFEVVAFYNMMLLSTFCHIDNCLVQGFTYRHACFAVVIDDPLLTLNAWIRSQSGLTGTKFMCYEGGCGSCIVTLEKPKDHFMAVNSVMNAV